MKDDGTGYMYMYIGSCVCKICTCTCINCCCTIRSYQDYSCDVMYVKYVPTADTLQGIQHIIHVQVSIQDDKVHVLSATNTYSLQVYLLVQCTCTYKPLITM